MDVSQYLVAELDDTVTRLRRQILDIVPLERQLERLPGANSATWITFHVARHAALALSIVTGTAGIRDPRLAVFDIAGADTTAGVAATDEVAEQLAVATRGGNGLQEVQQPFTEALDPATVNAYALGVFADVRRYLSTIEEPELDALLDIEAALDLAGIEHEQFDWLYRLWADQPVAFLARWPLTGHLTHHVGELTGLRNQMGLSPFR
ncbi:hypothetical protein [Subtercola sp. YIM 133946]|uniref:hypothetical protein n=1 Tax=Subtercola sp. YIM 133946 TaxID=3118909 RepID=UPI002F931416